MLDHYPHDQNEKLNEASLLIQQAEQLFKERKIEEAFHAYQEAGLLFKAFNDPAQAAKCFATAADCEKIRAGLEPLVDVATLSEQAAREAVKAKLYPYARWLYREAGLFYEREGDFERYSSCFVEAQDTFMKYLWSVFRTGKKREKWTQEVEAAGLRGRFAALVAWKFGLLSRLVWGYGEKPFRTLATACVIIVMSAGVYWLFDPVLVNRQEASISFLNALYMSGITFSTLGYGDFMPLGIAKPVAVLESLSGLLLMPLLLIGLTRRYLRVYR